MRYANGTLAELRALRNLDAELEGLPRPGVNVGQGPWASAADGETRWVRTIRRRVGGALRYGVGEQLLARAAAATATQIRNFLARRGVAVTLSEAQRLKDLAIAAAAEDDEGEDTE
jgi:hypothetical protein